MSSNAFSRKLNLDLLLNPIFYENRHDFRPRHDQPEVTVATNERRRNTRAKSVGISSVRNVGAMKNEKEVNVRLVRAETAKPSSRAQISKKENHLNFRTMPRAETALARSPRRTRELHKMSWVEIHKSKNLSPRKPQYEFKPLDTSSNSSSTSRMTSQNKDGGSTVSVQIEAEDKKETKKYASIATS